MRLAKLIIIPLALSIVGGAAPAPGERGTGNRDGSFPSKRQWFSTSLDVLQGADEVLVYYAGGFGPGCRDETKGGWCRSCDLGPVLARRESSGDFLIVSEGGKARLSVKSGAWQLRLVEGTADWCGVGWSGDDFRRNGDRPKPCAVATDGAKLLEAGAREGASPRRTVARGERLEALDALPTEEQQLLVKVQGVVGVMWRKDVSCRSR
jgi:hypothetical protein